MNKDLVAIFEYLEREKGVAREVVVEAIEEALLAAARKSQHGWVNVEVSVSAKTGEIAVFAQKEVVDKVTIPSEEIVLEKALEISPDAQLGDWVTVKVDPQAFGRIAAQVARQVIARKVQLASRLVVCREYEKKINEIVTGLVVKVVSRPRNAGPGDGFYVVELKNTEAILPFHACLRSDRFSVQSRVNALLLAVEEVEEVPKIILSRTDPQFVLQLLKQEVPEYEEGVVHVVGVAREPGYRTKLAVGSSDSKIDPLGAFVGMRGSRVKQVSQELNKERIEIYPWNDNLELFLATLLDPVAIKNLWISDDRKEVEIVVADDEYSVALGGRGSNARLSGELAGVNLRIKKESEFQQQEQEACLRIALEDDVSLDIPLAESRGGLNAMVVSALIAADLDTPRKVLSVTREKLIELLGLSEEMVHNIFEQIRKIRG